MDRLPCPQKEVLWLEKSDHVLLLDSERDVVTDKVLSFVNGKAPVF
jgi:esterase/lipase